MTEPTLKYCKLHLLLLNEWKSKTSVKETKKIVNERMGKKYVTTKKVQKWFYCYDNEYASIFDKNSALYASIQNNPTITIDSLLFLSDEDKYYEFKLIKCNDRFIEYLQFEGNYSIVLYDLFLNVKKKIKLPIDVRDFKVIGNEFYLLFDGYNMNLCKPDYENSIFNSLDSIKYDGWIESILVDQQNPLKFMVCIKDDTFALGEVSGEKIVLGDFNNHNDFNFKHLMDNKLHGFDYDNELKSVKFCELILDTMEENKIDVPIDLNDELLSVLNFKPEIVCWSKSCFYGMFEMSDDKYHILMFNPKTLKWTNIQVVAISPRKMFVDSNEMLTLKVGNWNDDGFYAYYRFNLRKPDTLKNLVHLAISRQSTLFENNKYLKCVKRLPVQS